MLSGVKFIPRNQIHKAQEENFNASVNERKKSSSRKEKHRRKSKGSRYNSSSDDEELERIKKSSRKKKKWYSSDEYSSSYSSGAETDTDSDEDEKKHMNKKKDKRSSNDTSGEEASQRSKKRLIGERKHYSSENCSTSTSDDEEGIKGRHQRRSKKNRGIKSKKRKHEKGTVEEDNVDDVKEKEIMRKEIGLEWMVRPEEKTDRQAKIPSEPQPEEHQTAEVKKDNPKELNPYLKDNGIGYPEESDQRSSDANQLLASSVGDGGASWRLKALKRAQEQAAREGRKLEEVVEERWGSLGQLAVSVASRAAAPSRAHLHAIKNRKRELTDEHETVVDNQNKGDIEKDGGKDYLQDVSLRHPEMKAPKLHDSLSWRKHGSKKLSSRDSGLISAAASSLNKFSDNGSFMHEFMHRPAIDSGSPHGSLNTSCEGKGDAELASLKTSKNNDEDSVVKHTLSANQLAAKALQLRMRGKHEEADKLLKEAESIKEKQESGDKLIRQQNEGGTSRYIRQEISLQQKKKQENSDVHLAERIVQNRRYGVTNEVDDEYDFDDGPSKKSRKKRGGSEHKLTDSSNFSKRILTQQERCQFCFENPNRPRHLVISIANFTYLMLPQWQPVVPGHCCILPLQHESATRTVDDDVWEEIRNFKKCLIMMFAKQEMDLVFLETVIGLSQQRRHCLIECIPLPRDIAKQAPLYFKKAIDEAEDEWSQHNAKKLIDTSKKGLRGSIPKDFPYFHVEFGLNRGFVHVIDDEKQFKSSLGLNVIRGMLRLPEEDMHRRRRLESLEAQKQAVVSFAHDWEPFDWTKQLG
ncbi:uncharacterized protein LOC131165888 [Malania oleifera]|uniref:uncharacterized protein LOC131165888 n=1 Tax=Malania oleifera TaxID=397392 RepID=UPI0025ADDDB2|nr:uncharacterized protein LOC131165888 [Malania oleifera]XP_057980020.1 uncharacterized protein LOC131165888 [Malania oleifera]XP_057980022.1 uncharacterized protein LOC131165888 [Malania oleifera]